MRLKLTVAGAATPAGTIDLDIEAPVDLTVGELATELAERSPHHNPPAATLAISRTGVAAQPIDPSVAVRNTDIVSGMTVELVAPGVPVAPGRDTAPTAVAIVTAGPDTGRRFPLFSGANIVGREASTDVMLADEAVSRRHLQIDIGTQLTVTDLGSANGTIIGDEPISTATVAEGTSITLGTTTFQIELDAAGAGAFVRSPPTAAPVIPEEIEAPKVPPKKKPPRIPVIAAIAPVFMGAAMYMLTQRVQTLIFIALSPIMLLGNAVESRISNRKSNKEAHAKFAEEFAAFTTDSRARLDAEVRHRRAEHPDLASLTAALHARTPTLWSRRPDAEHYAELCIGRGRQPARHTFTSSPGEEAAPNLLEELNELLETLTHLDDVPVVVDLATEGSVGVAGPEVLARSVAASMVASAAVLHSPAELTIALLSSEQAGSEWSWMRWLPHVDGRYAPFDHPVADTPGGCMSLQAALSQLLDARAAQLQQSSRARHLPTVLVVIENDAPVERSLLVDLLERGPAVGIHPLWVAPAVDRLPAGCGAVVDTSNGSSQMSVRVRRTKETHVGVAADLIGLDDLERLGRALSPIVDTGARARGDSGLPDVVPGPQLLGLPPTPSAEDLLHRWRATAIDGPARGDTRLSAPVGIAGGDPFTLDLRKQGPHALVGGTTGAGKSEFLQSWVMGLAANYSAKRVNFLFVDYKGGAAFSECVKLPHCVGLVTDLSPHLVDRALGSLHAELHRREHLFNELDAKDVIDLEKRGLDETPPVLIIVVDEFAALVQEVPDFVDGVVNVAQRGRSLGLHLILATQRPAGVITGNLRANTNIRVALRMADESDSSDVIDVNDAARIDASHPGRGFAKAGPGRITPFQSAFYGGRSTDAGASRAVGLRPLGITMGDPWPSVKRESPGDDEPNDLARLVAATQRAALAGGYEEPRRPWLPELPTALDLRELAITGTDLDLVFGRADVPSEQAQPPIAFQPDRDGNLAVFGGSGSGKSTVLRTLGIVAGAATSAPATGSGPCHVYAIDVGSRSLQMLEAFPHVGAVIDGDDHERISRLLRTLRQTIDERQTRFGAAAADTIADFRKRSGDADEARIIVLIDNYGTLRQNYDTPERAATLDLLSSIMADGRSAGVHVVFTADRPGAVPSAVTSMVPRRLVLRLANENDLMLIGEPSGVLTNDTPPGRGLEEGREFQVAVLGGTPNLAEQVNLARALAQNDGFRGQRQPAPPVLSLPTDVMLGSLPMSVGDRPVIGVEDIGLGPLSIEPTGGFLVAGPPGSGRTTALATIAGALHRWRPDFQRVLFAERRSPLLDLPWTTAAQRANDHIELAQAITNDLRALEGEVKGLGIFIENVTELIDDPTVEGAVLDLIKAALAVDAFVVVEGEASQLARAWKLDPIKNQRTGLLLQPQMGDGDLLKANLPRIGRNEFPVGRAIHVARRQLTKVQIAQTDGFST